MSNVLVNTVSGRISLHEQKDVLWEAAVWPGLTGIPSLHWCHFYSHACGLHL